MNDAEYEKLAIVVHVIQTTQNIGCFAKGGKEMYQEL